MPVEMRIASLMIDPNSGLPIVLLMEISGGRAVPIVIGMAEAEAIALALQKAAMPRPRTHDLLRDMLVGLGGRLERITVSDLRESTFYALLTIRIDGEVVELDSRPSDAIALACRTGATIYMDESVLERARLRTAEEAGPESNHQEENAEDGADRSAADPPTMRPILIDPDASADELSELLRNLEPEDFKYKM